MSKPDALADAMRKISKPAPASVPLSTEPVGDIRRTPSRRGQRVITVFVDPAIHRQLRGLSFELDVPIQALALEAIGDLFEKHGRPRLT